jgi:hypothetical protein
VLATSSCSSPTSPTTIATGSACNPTAASANLVLPFLQKPFGGEAALKTHFDHDRPLL